MIPPSILAILFAVVAQQSVGELFIGAVIPGLILSSAMYIAFVVVYSDRCWPKAGAQSRIAAGRAGQYTIEKFQPARQHRSRRWRW